MKRTRAQASGWPTFDSPLLQEVVNAFLRRRKSIAHRVSLSCEREFSETANGVFERVNLDAGALRLSTWSDGEMWLAVCVPRPGRGAGWAFKDTFHGNVGDVGAATLVRMLEATLELPFGLDPQKEREQLWGIWARVYPRRSG